MTQVTAKLVKQLRDMTGAGMMDGKRALLETDGNLEQAVELLRQKNLLHNRTCQGSNRKAAEGVIESYIHATRRIGVLVEVNCETDFVSRTSTFRELARNIAMHIAASETEYIQLKDIPADVVKRERVLESNRDDLVDKPAELREKIVGDRIEKRLKEITLLEQPYIRDPTITVDQLIRLNMANLGENIEVSRFARFSLGELRSSL
jgi:elongation factor Ts